MLGLSVNTLLFDVPDIIRNLDVDRQNVHHFRNIFKTRAVNEAWARRCVTAIAAAQRAFGRTAARLTRVR
jgi:hypothetical protein